MQQKTNFPVKKRAFYAFKIEGEKKLFKGNEEDIVNYFIQYYKTQFKAYPIVKWFWMIQFEGEYFGFQTIFTLKKQYSLLIKNFIEINGEVVGITDLTSEPKDLKESKPLPFVSMIKKYLEFAIENGVEYCLIDDNTQKLKQEETKIKEKIERKKQGTKKDKKQKKQKNEELPEEIKVEETKMEETKMEEEIKEEQKMEEEVKEIKIEETKMEEESCIQIIKEEQKTMEEVIEKITQIQEEEKKKNEEERKVIPLKRKSLLTEIENPLLVKERERKMKEEKKPKRVEEVIDTKIEETKKKKRTKKTRVKTKRNHSEDELEKHNDVEQKSKNEMKLAYWWNINNQQLMDLKERICQIIQNKKCLFIVCKENIEEKIRILINERLIEKDKIIYCESLFNICQEEENKVLRIFESVNGIDYYSLNRLNFGYVFRMNFRDHKPIGSLFIVNEKHFEEMKQVVLMTEDIVFIVDDMDCFIETQESDDLLIDIDSIEPLQIKSTSPIPLFPSVLPNFDHNQELNSCPESFEKDDENDPICLGVSYDLNISDICKKESFDDVPF